MLPTVFDNTLVELNLKSEDLPEPLQELIDKFDELEREYEDQGMPKAMSGRLHQLDLEIAREVLEFSTGMDLGDFLAHGSDLVQKRNVAILDRLAGVNKTEKVYRKELEEMGFSGPFGGRRIKVGPYFLVRTSPLWYCYRIEMAG